MTFANDVARQVMNSTRGKNKIKKPKNWDAVKNVAGPTTKPGEVFSCNGFKMFTNLDDAVAYADTLKFSSTMWDDVVDRWTVTPLNAFYG